MTGLAQLRPHASPAAQPTPAATPAGTTPRPPVRRRWWQVLLFPALLVVNYVVIQQLAPGHHSAWRSRTPFSNRRWRPTMSSRSALELAVLPISTSTTAIV